MLDLEDLSAIIAHPSLTLKSEDSLCEIILTSWERDPAFASLFEFVRFEFVSVEVMNEVIEYLSNCFDYVTWPVWRQLSRRLALAVSPGSVNGREFVEDILFPFSLTSPFEGIFSYLVKDMDSGCNPDLIAITSRSLYMNDLKYSPTNTIGLGKGTLFVSKPGPSQWVCYDFRNLRVKVSAYSLRTASNASGDAHLRNWVIEGSNFGTDWTELDRREQCDILNRSSAVASFTISLPESDPFRRIRLRQIGENHKGTELLAFCRFELFGALSRYRK
jgi:hypothetical protein